MDEQRKYAAERLKTILIEISPLIEEYSRLVCPGCRDVCCRQEHGTYKQTDLIYRNALGLSLPVHDSSVDPRSPCPFTGPAGCVQPRWLRPLKCTWFFCEPVLATMNEGPQKKARRVSAALQEVVDCIGQLQRKEGT